MNIIPHNSPIAFAEECEAAAAVLKSGILADGPQIKAFENEFCACHGLPSGHAVAVSSGTAAVFLALTCLNIAGKKVVIPAYGCSALRNAAALAGGKIAVSDIATEGPNLNPLNLHENEAAVFPYHFGIPSDIRRCNCRLLIEDCAQALGAKIGMSPVGTIGVCGVFSFYATKIISSAGAGGMLISKDKALVDCARDYVDFDNRRDEKIRFNLKMTEIQAAVGRVQLKHLSSILNRREEIFQQYSKIVPLIGPDFCDCSPIRYRAVIKTDHPQRIIQHLMESGIRAIIPYERAELLADLPNAVHFSENTVSLPLYPALTDQQVNFIMERLEECI